MRVCLTVRSGEECVGAHQAGQGGRASQAEVTGGAKAVVSGGEGRGGGSKAGASGPGLLCRDLVKSSRGWSTSDEL